MSIVVLVGSIDDLLDLDASDVGVHFCIRGWVLLRRTRSSEADTLPSSSLSSSWKAFRMFSFLKMMEFSRQLVTN